jgi:hypothetical protein
MESKVMSGDLNSSVLLIDSVPAESLDDYATYVLETHVVVDSRDGFMRYEFVLPHLTMLTKCIDVELDGMYYGNTEVYMAYETGDSLIPLLQFEVINEKFDLLPYLLMTQQDLCAMVGKKIVLLFACDDLYLPPDTVVSVTTVGDVDFPCLRSFLCYDGFNYPTFELSFLRAHMSFYVPMTYGRIGRDSFAFFGPQEFGQSDDAGVRTAVPLDMFVVPSDGTGVRSRSIDFNEDGEFEFGGSIFYFHPEDHCYVIRAHLLQLGLLLQYDLRIVFLPKDPDFPDNECVRRFLAIL